MNSSNNIVKRVSLMLIFCLSALACNESKTTSTDFRLPEDLNEEYIDLLAREIYIEKFPDSVDQNFKKKTARMREKLTIKIQNYENQVAINKGLMTDSKDSMKSDKYCSLSYNESIIRKRFQDLSKDIYGLSLLNKKKYDIEECEFVFIVNGFDNSRNRGYTCTIKTGGGQILETECELKKY